MTDDPRLSKRALATIKNTQNEVLLSAAVAWEMAIKVKLGKINPASLVESLQDAVLSETFIDLPIALEHAIRAGLLPLHHRDPFDRVLVAQAMSMEIPIVSADRLLDLYKIERMW
jgi:PIN domain nuclease of toxin-antitoxin system